MSQASESRIALVCDYLPRRCGIATFSRDVCMNVPGGCAVVSVSDVPGGYDYPPEVRFEIDEEDLGSYRRAADFLNCADPDVVCLQHEFGIFGGEAGAHILALLRRLRVPLVTHLHTVLDAPDAAHRAVMRELARLSARLVVMTERGLGMLRDVYDVPVSKIDLIPHGIPDMPFVDPIFYKDRFGIEGRRVLLTFGLISPSKGIEYVIRALPGVLKVAPDLVYIVLGATHPHLIRDQGESYRRGLERLVLDSGLKDHVVFHDRFVELDELVAFIGAADIYITPYLDRAQVSSGTLAYAFGCGKPVISTPYWHAEELLADGRGVLVPFRDSGGIARELIALLTDDARRNAIRRSAYELGRGMIWSEVGLRLQETFRRAREEPGRIAVRRLAAGSAGRGPRRLPELRLDHLRRLSDSAGVFQHATYDVPNFAEGYCTDDNARVLLLAALLEGAGDRRAEVRGLASTCSAFLQHAFVADAGRFHNFMGYDRRWLDATGSDDCLGRALWALGACVGRSRRDGMRRWAARLFSLALPSAVGATSPRCWAAALLGIREHERRLGGDLDVARIREVLVARLLEEFRAASGEGWMWFEGILSYANALLPHALIACGSGGGHAEALEVGLRSLRWLMGVQSADLGHFAPIGSDGFYPRGGVRARFDQQPIDAHASVVACLEAYAATGDTGWLRDARRAFDWYMGGNDIGHALYDPLSGGCRDALHVDRVNLNQGAESTVSFLLALHAMGEMERWPGTPVGG